MEGKNNNNTEVLAAIADLSQKMSTLDGKVSGLDSKFQGLDKKLSTVHQELSNNIKGIDIKVERLDIEVKGLNTCVQGLDNKIESVHKELSQDIADLGQAVGQHFEESKENANERFEKVESDIYSLKGDVLTIKSSMVTKDYLDDKIGEIHGDFNGMMREEDKKVVTLTEVLTERKAIQPSDARRVFALPPFPKQ